MLPKLAGQLLIGTPFKQIIPVRVQGELVSADSLLVLAMIAMVKKFGKDNTVLIDQREAVDLIGNTKDIEIAYNFEKDALQVRVR